MKILVLCPGSPDWWPDEKSMAELKKIVDELNKPGDEVSALILPSPWTWKLVDVDRVIVAAEADQARQTNWDGVGNPLADVETAKEDCRRHVGDA